MKEEEFDYQDIKEEIANSEILATTSVISKVSLNLESFFVVV